MTDTPDPRSQRGAARLSEADAETLDRWIEDRTGEARSAQTPPPPAERQARLEALLHLLEMDAPPAEPPRDLATRTLARVREAQPAPIPVIDRPVLASTSTSWGQVIAVAAMFLAAVTLLWPILSHGRQQARQIACAAHLAQIGEALGRYAETFQGLMPRKGSWPGETWWQVGSGHQPGEPVRSNAAHLYLLVRGGYTSAPTLNCPDNPHAPRTMSQQASDWPRLRAVSYSYQNQYTHEPIRLDQDPSGAVLADKNPLFRERESGGVEHDPEVPSHASSESHDQRGQNVLKRDGHVAFHESPILAGGDNIWMLQGHERYSGREIPRRTDEAFLVP